MTYLLVIIAGAIQGLSEFLPISSTAHLIIFEKLTGLRSADFGLSFDASLHLGTLLAILIFFYKDYLKILNFKNKLAVKLIIGTIPAAIAGLAFDSYIENNVRSLWVIAIGLIAFSAVIYLAEKMATRKKTQEQTSLLDSFLVGFSQAIALIPGVSRSGATISAGLFLGLKRTDAAKFAFLLSGPIIAGAGSKKFLEVLVKSQLSGARLEYFTLGIISSAIFGYITIKYFIRYLSTNNLDVFIVYRLALAAVLIAYLIWLR